MKYFIIKTATKVAITDCKEECTKEEFIKFKKVLKVLDKLRGKERIIIDTGITDEPISDELLYQVMPIEDIASIEQSFIKIL